MGEYTVRRFTPDDLERIVEIERACFGREAYDRNLFAEYFRRWGELFLVAANGRNICGYVIACIRGERAEVVSLAVEPPARGKGAASALLAATVRRVRRRGATRLGLTVKVTNARAMAFYEKSGFRKLRRVRRYYEDATDGFIMTKQLGRQTK